MNIKEINISITNSINDTNIIINCENKTIDYNGQITIIDIDKIYELLNIIRTWEKTYMNKAIIDSERYQIEIIDINNKHDVYIGQGKYPPNYTKLKRWIKGV